MDITIGKILLHPPVAQSFICILHIFCEWKHPPHLAWLVLLLYDQDLTY